MENISSSTLDLDLGWEETDRVSLPGFGFFPPRVIQILENITAVKLEWVQLFKTFFFNNETVFSNTLKQFKEEAENNNLDLSLLQRDQYDEFQVKGKCRTVEYNCYWFEIWMGLCLCLKF